MQMTDDDSVLTAPECECQMANSFRSCSWRSTFHILEQQLTPETMVVFSPSVKRPFPLATSGCGGTTRSQTHSRLPLSLILRAAGKQQALTGLANEQKEDSEQEYDMHRSSAPTVSRHPWPRCWIIIQESGAAEPLHRPINQHLFSPAAPKNSGMRLTALRVRLHRWRRQTCTHIVIQVWSRVPSNLLTDTDRAQGWKKPQRRTDSLMNPLKNYWKKYTKL